MVDDHKERSTHLIHVILIIIFTRHPKAVPARVAKYLHYLQKFCKTALRTVDHEQKQNYHS